MATSQRPEEERAEDGQQTQEPDLESILSSPPDLADVDGRVRMQREVERLRQERETFDQQKLQDKRSFRLRMTMGYVAVGVIPAVVAICVWLLIDPGMTVQIKTIAVTALLVDVLGLAVAVWKLVLGSGPMTRLQPVTQSGY